MAIEPVTLTSAGGTQSITIYDTSLSATSATFLAFLSGISTNTNCPASDGVKANSNTVTVAWAASAPTVVLSANPTSLGNNSYTTLTATYTYPSNPGAYLYICAENNASELIITSGSTSPMVAKQSVSATGGTVTTQVGDLETYSVQATFLAFLSGISTNTNCPASDGVKANSTTVNVTWAGQGTTTTTQATTTTTTTAPSSADVTLTPTCNPCTGGAQLGLTATAPTYPSGVNLYICVVSSETGLSGPSGPFPYLAAQPNPSGGAYGTITGSSGTTAAFIAFLSTKGGLNGGTTTCPTSPNTSLGIPNGDTTWFSGEVFVSWATDTPTTTPYVPPPGGTAIYVNPSNLSTDPSVSPGSTAAVIAEGFDAVGAWALVICASNNYQECSAASNNMSVSTAWSNSAGSAVSSTTYSPYFGYGATASGLQCFAWPAGGSYNDAYCAINVTNYTAETLYFGTHWASYGGANYSPPASATWAPPAPSVTLSASTLAPDDGQTVTLTASGVNPGSDTLYICTLVGNDTTLNLTAGQQYPYVAAAANPDNTSASGTAESDTGQSATFVAYLSPDADQQISGQCPSGTLDAVSSEVTIVWPTPSVTLSASTNTPDNSQLVTLTAAYANPGPSVAIYVCALPGFTAPLTLANYPSPYVAAAPVPIASQQVSGTVGSDQSQSVTFVAYLSGQANQEVSGICPSGTPVTTSNEVTVTWGNNPSNGPSVTLSASTVVAETGQQVFFESQGFDTSPATALYICMQTPSNPAGMTISDVPPYLAAADIPTGSSSEMTGGSATSGIDQSVTFVAFLSDQQGLDAPGGTCPTAVGQDGAIAFSPTVIVSWVAANPNTKSARYPT
jgi:hypothetical protein